MGVRLAQAQSDSNCWGQENSHLLLSAVAVLQSWEDLLLGGGGWHWEVGKVLLSPHPSSSSGGREPPPAALCSRNCLPSPPPRGSALLTSQF